ncbi:MAG: DUF488 domain-containing protein [Balneolaceae bacterium]|nr:DUF488 domain-containing protein [Balneolaceae bacterium]
MCNYYPVKTKRIYEEPAAQDGYRVLVDRLWPRGVSKEDAQLDAWLKEIAPSDDLRKWFNHDPDKFEEFKQRYNQELRDKEELLVKLLKKSAETPVTLLYAAKDTQHNQAVVLAEWLRSKQHE